jgi:hypothetical protein
MEKTLDDLIHNNNIKWFPWVGEGFNQNEHRILIVGESHYYNPQEEGSFEKHQDSKFTIEIIRDLAINRNYYNTKVFQNFHKALIGNDTFNSLKLWGLLSFYNFVQAPMNTNKGRPQYEDFYNGWISFFELLKILKPTVCIFIGTSAANSFNDFIQNNQIFGNKVINVSKIGRNFSKKSSIYLNQQEIDIHFIRHSSQYFSWKLWNEFLNSTIPNEINFLKKNII